MAKINALYTSRVAPGLNFDIPEVAGKSIEVTGFFTRQSNGFGQKMTKPKEGTHFRPNEEGVETFWVIKIDGLDDLWVANVAQLNRFEGFKECVSVDGDFATLADGVVMSSSGREATFAIQA